MQPEESTLTSRVFHGTSPTVMLPASTVFPDIRPQALTVTFVPIGPDEGERFTFGACAPEGGAVANHSANASIAASSILAGAAPAPIIPPMTS
jgi:hypothetical protein